VPTVAAALLVALTAWLGNWQLDRANEKRARQALFESRMHDNPLRLTGSVPSADPILYRHVRVSGTWMPQAQIYIDNQIHEGRAGFAVITPVAIEGASAAVLVNRGWVERSRAYPRPPEVATPSGHADVSGLATRPPARFLELGAGEAVTGNVWQNLSIERVARASGQALLPVVVLQEPAGQGLAPVREAPDAGVAKHVEYAFTWFALAATAIALWLALNLKRRP